MIYEDLLDASPGEQTDFVRQVCEELEQNRRWLEEEALPRMTPSQRAAFDWVLHKRGDYCFITGPGGTGKSFLLKAVMTMLELWQGAHVAVLASTGTAAHLIGGQTVHRFFRLQTDLGSRLQYGTDEWATVTHTDVLIIDEVSMMSCHLLEAIDRECRRCALRVHQERPFGAKRLILFGDLYQLPPVLRTGDDAPIYAHRLWPLFQVLHLQESCRQQGDAPFFDLLNRLRVGALEKKDWELLQSRVCGTGHALSPACRPWLSGTPGAVLVACHKQKDSINARRLETLSSKLVVLPALDTDAQGHDLSSEEQEQLRRVQDRLPDVCTLKVHALCLLFAFLKHNT